MTYEMACYNCDPVWCSVPISRRRRTAKHKDKKSFTAIAYTGSQTPKEETDSNSVVRHFAETKESFSESIANRDAQEQVKTQESVSHSNTGRIAVGNRDSVRESGGITRSRSRKKRLA